MQNRAHQKRTVCLWDEGIYTCTTPTWEKMSPQTTCQAAVHQRHQNVKSPTSAVSGTCTHSGTTRAIPHGVPHNNGRDLDLTILVFCTIWRVLVWVVDFEGASRVKGDNDRRVKSIRDNVTFRFILVPGRFNCLSSTTQNIAEVMVDTNSIDTIQRVLIRDAMVPALSLWSTAPSTTPMSVTVKDRAVLARVDGKRGTSRLNRSPVVFKWGAYL